MNFDELGKNMKLGQQNASFYFLPKISFILPDTAKKKTSVLLTNLFYKIERIMSPEKRGIS